MKTQKRTIAAIAMSIVMSISGSVYAERIQWKVENGGNGHWYERVDNRVTWHEAKQLAEEMGGHLVTITSEAENVWFFDNIVDPVQANTWFGATDEDSEGTWRWVTGEPWSYTKWDSHQPDNARGVEHYLHYYPSHPFYFWNDWPGNAAADFVVEYEGVDCDASVYSTIDNTLSFNSLAMELYNPITDEPAGKFALYTGGDMSLKALPGFYDFKYKGGEPVYADQIVEKLDNCYPTYSAEEETLQFPKIKVPLLGVLPDGSTVDGPAACYKAEFNHSMTQPEIFTLADADEVACE